MDYPSNYQLFNSLTTKNLNIVVTIDGVGTFFTSSELFTKIRYGDPIEYGGEGLVYGGLRPLTSADGSNLFKSLLNLDNSSMTISQRLEPEQGRGAVSTLSISFNDENEYFSQIISPGVLIDEILGRNVTIRLGYIQTSYPEDYFIVFRGIISQVTSGPGLVTFQLSDSNIKRRQQLFFMGATTLTGGIDNTTTTINVASNGDFFQQIIGPNGGYDPAIHTYFKIDDEWIEYTQAGFGTNTFTSVTRGARGTTAASHDDAAPVTAGIQIEDNTIDMALKLMLSGENGSWITAQPIVSLGIVTDPSIPNQSHILLLPNNVDADQDYGLVEGDYITITGATNPSNNITARVIDFGDIGGRPNQIIYLDTALTPEVTTSAVFSIRSQYDTYPELAGLALKPFEVDIQRHLDTKRLFLVGSENSYRFFLTEPKTGKDFIEMEIYLPASCYSLTRFGRLSIGITKPPIADERLQFLNKDNITTPESIAPNRGLNSRKFFNEIQFYWDADDTGAFLSRSIFLDDTSLSLIGISSVLPIQSSGARTDLGTNTQFPRRAQFLLSRYKRGAVNIQLTVNWEVGSLIEAGDVVALDGEGLKITNFSSGQRDFATQLFEVTGRSLDMKNGNVQLTLVAGIGAEATDRFGTISPSSNLTNGSTTTQLMIEDSYGPLYPNNESRKWRNYLGEGLRVHSEDWTYVEDTVLQSISTTNLYQLNVSPPLSAPPPSGYIIDIIQYPLDINPLASAKYKAIHAFLDPQVEVVSGFTVTSFSVDSGDITKFFAGTFVRVHDYFYVNDSGDVQVSAVDTGTNTVYLDSTLGFVPTGNFAPTGDRSLVDLIGFYPDEGGPYRFI